MVPRHIVVGMLVKLLDQLKQPFAAHLFKQTENQGNASNLVEGMGGMLQLLVIHSMGNDILLLVHLQNITCHDRIM